MCLFKADVLGNFVFLRRVRKSLVWGCAVTMSTFDELALLVQELSSASGVGRL